MLKERGGRWVLAVAAVKGSCTSRKNIAAYLTSFSEQQPETLRKSPWYRQHHQVMISVRLLQNWSILEARFPPPPLLLLIRWCMKETNVLLSVTCWSLLISSALASGMFLMVLMYPAFSEPNPHQVPFIFFFLWIFANQQLNEKLLQLWIIAI